MRRAFHDFGFIEEDGVFFGVTLGFDFTAEHEWGISDMKRVLEIPELKKSNAGIKSRMIGIKHPETVIHYKEDGKYTYLYMREKYPWEKDTEPKIPEYCLKKGEIDWIIKDNARREKKQDEILTAWDGKEFGMLTKGEENRARLKELHDAILKHDAALTFMNLNGKNPFANACLSLLIASKLPKDTLGAMKEADENSLELSAITKKLNLLERLRKTNKFGEYSLHAASPHFIDSEEKRKLKTKYDVSVWINSGSFYGWCTVEEVEELIKDKNLTVEEFKKRKEAQKNG